MHSNQWENSGKFVEQNSLNNKLLKFKEIITKLINAEDKIDKYINKRLSKASLDEKILDDDILYTLLVIKIFYLKAAKKETFNQDFSTFFDVIDFKRLFQYVWLCPTILQHPKYQMLLEYFVTGVYYAKLDSFFRKSIFEDSLKILKTPKKHFLTRLERYLKVKIISMIENKTPYKVMPDVARRKENKDRERSDIYKDIRKVKKELRSLGIKEETLINFMKVWLNEFKK